jgi:membrane protease YdiL (CAAX protease family)
LQPILSYISEFYRKDIKLAYFLLILLLTGFLIYLNYSHSFEPLYVATRNSKCYSFFFYYFLYLIPFAAAFFLQYLFYKNCTYLKNYWFWIILLLSPAVFSFRINFNFHHTLIKKIWEADELIFWLQSFSWLFQTFALLIPVYIIWLIKDKNNQPLYGMKPLKQATPYFIMLLIMVPLIIIACTQKDFLATYPKAQFLESLDLSSKKWYYIIYELCYGFDFLSIELFFRGFLILSLFKICGPQCIIPVACFYCTIHFGKPAGEAISSFWGALLLGIISYNTRSIWGGLIIHLGIAWLMELISWLSRYLH